MLYELNHETLIAFQQFPAKDCRFCGIREVARLNSSGLVLQPPHPLSPPGLPARPAAVTHGGGQARQVGQAGAGPPRQTATTTQCWCVVAGREAARAQDRSLGPPPAVRQCRRLVRVRGMAGQSPPCSPDQDYGLFLSENGHLSFENPNYQAAEINRVKRAGCVDGCCCYFQLCLMA